MTGLPRPPSADGYPTLCLALLAQEPAHGYDIVQRLAARTEGAMQLPHGLVYAILHDLERQGLADATWEEGSPGRRRREYSITAAGLDVLARRRAQWTRHRLAVDRVFLGGAAVLTDG